MKDLMNHLVFLCFAGFSLLSAMCVAIVFDESLPDRARRIFTRSRIGAAIVILFVVGLVHYGATKNVTFTDGLKDDGTTAISNDVVRIGWTRDVSHVVVPLSAPVYIEYRVAGSTNDWGLLAQSVVSAGFWEGTVPNATNYDYHVWAYYIPPEPVHTNGVWEYRTMKDRSGRNPIPLRARVEINGKSISTPKQRRQDEKK